MPVMSEYYSDLSRAHIRTTSGSQSDTLSGMGKKLDPFRMATGRRLEALRLAKGFDTIRAFAKAMEVEEDRYTTWEKGKALIPPQMVQKLRVTYGITSDWLYFGDAAGLTVGLYESLKIAA